MNLLKKHFTPADVDAITASIRAAEKKTAGEVRVEIRQRRRVKEKDMSVEQIARREFVDLGMMETKDRTGVLMFLLLEERQFCILADEGIHAKAGQYPWEEIAGNMTRAFKAGRFAEGVRGGVDDIGKILAMHVPPRPEDTNELTDEVGMS